MSMVKNVMSQGCQPIRESHAMQVNNRIHYIADKLENLAGRLEEQLRPVLGPQAPCETAKDNQATPRRPVLFEELHVNLDALDRWVDSLGCILNRIEL